MLWLEGNAFVAAFEIESTTRIDSGLPRMAELLAMQANLTIPLYLVAPDERRNKVLSEVKRPTFSRLSPPLREACRYLAFSVLRDQPPADPRVVRHVPPPFPGDFSESCEIEPPCQVRPASAKRTRPIAVGDGPGLGRLSRRRHNG